MRVSNEARRNRRRSDGTAHDFAKPAADGIGGMFGMAVDDARRTLSVATTSLPRMRRFAAADSGRVGVYGYDLDTGRLRRRTWAPRDPSVAHTPAFRSPQCMAITPEGSMMFVADYLHGLMRVDLRSTAVTPLRVPTGVTLLGIDGLYLRRGALIGVQNGVAPARIARFCLDADGRGVRQSEIVDRNTALADEPTLGVVVGDSLFYVATSQWDKFDDAGARVARSVLRPATVLGVALDSKTACKR